MRRSNMGWAFSLWFYNGRDLCLGFSCQKHPSHHMMMSLIPRDLGVKTEWFWLPPFLKSLLYSKGSSFELCRILKQRSAPGCKDSL